MPILIAFFGHLTFKTAIDQWDADNELSYVISMYLYMYPNKAKHITTHHWYAVWLIDRYINIHIEPLCSSISFLFWENVSVELTQYLLYHADDGCYSISISCIEYWYLNWHLKAEQIDRSQYLDIVVWDHLTLPSSWCAETDSIWPTSIVVLYFSIKSPWKKTTTTVYQFYRHIYLPVQSVNKKGNHY